MSRIENDFNMLISYGKNLYWSCVAGQESREKMHNEAEGCASKWLSGAWTFLQPAWQSYKKEAVVIIDNRPMWSFESWRQAQPLYAFYSIVIDLLLLHLPPSMGEDKIWFSFF